MQSMPPRIHPATLTPGLVTLMAALSAVALNWLGPLAYPFRLLTTIMHELSHGLVAILTGGTFVRFVVFADGSGMAYTAGGIRWLIIPAGYVGAALCGAALIALGRGQRRSQLALGILGASLAILAVRYGLPSVFSPQVLSGLLTVGVGVGMGALFLAVARRGGAHWSLFLLNLMAFWVGLSALGDLTTVFGMATARTDIPSDAHAMSSLTFLPPAFWALIWVLIASAALGATLWQTWVRPRPS